MNKKMIDALNDCLQRMEHGESLDSVLVGYPHLAAQLRPLLMTAVRVRSANQELVPPNLLSRQRSRGLNLAADLHHRKIRHPLYRGFGRTAVAFLSVIVILVMSSNGLLVASAHSIPGDSLYPFKRSVELTQLNFVSDLTQRQILEQTFSERRVDETKSLITIHRIEDVDFTGVVMSQSGDQWLVSGIPVVVPSQVDMDDGIEIGDDIDVQGSTDTDGNVEAMRLSLVTISDADDGQPVALPTQTPTSEPSGKSDFMETPTESAIAPAQSGEAGKQVLHSEDQQSPKYGEDRSSGETSHTSHSSSDGGGDQ